MSTSTHVVNTIASHRQTEFVYIKDEHSRYTYANEWFLSFYHLTHLEQIYHKTDHDLPWGIFAELYIKHDHEAMMSGELQVIEPTVAADGTEVLILSHKYNFVDPKTMQSGMMGISRLVHSNVMKSALPVMEDQYINSIKLSENLFNIKVNAHTKNPLTERELDVLYYLLHGLSQKQIADKLNLSVRTVEDYVDHVKVKLSCGNKNQLFEFALQHGLMNIVPKKLLN